MKINKSLKEKFLDAMELPLELLSDEARITLLGNKNLLIENYKGIVEYNENIISFTNAITLIGKNLNIEEINNDEIFVTGEITNIEFEWGGKNVPKEYY